MAILDALDGYTGKLEAAKGGVLFDFQAFHCAPAHLERDFRWARIEVTSHLRARGRNLKRLALRSSLRLLASSRTSPQQAPSIRVFGISSVLEHRERASLFFLTFERKCLC